MANTRFIHNAENKSQATWYLVRSEWGCKVLEMVILRSSSVETKITVGN